MLGIYNAFRKAYNPTPDERREQIELSKRIDIQAKKEKRCSTCKSCILKNGYQPGGAVDTYEVCSRGKETGESCELYELADCNLL